MDVGDTGTRARLRQEKWPEHRDFFETVGGVLAHYGAPEEIGLDDGRVAAYHLADLSPLVRGEVVVIPKFVAGLRRAPATTMSSWLNSLPESVRRDYPAATGILLTNSPVAVTAGGRSFKIWGREVLNFSIRRGDPGFSLLAPFLPPPEPSDDERMPEPLPVNPQDLPQARSGVTLDVVVDAAGWRLPADAFVLPAGLDGSLAGAAARAFLADVGSAIQVDIQRRRPEVFSTSAPYSVTLPPPFTRTLIVATAYGDGIQPEEAFIAAVRLAAKLKIRKLAVPLLGAAQLGEEATLRRMLEAVERLPRVTMEIVLVVMQDSLAALAKRLIPAAARTRGAAVTLPAAIGFSNDTAEGVDLLGVDKQAETFARLLASQKVKMPLAVGLFGNWGSGKSFFMHLIDSHLDQLRRGEQASDTKGAGVYYRGVAAIGFNAWHYTDSELWPSLALRIFDGVAAFMAGEDKTETDAETINLRQKLAREVASNERARGEAEQTLIAARDQRAKVQQELLEAQQARQSTADDLRFGEFVGEVFAGAGPVLSAAGLPGAAASLKQAEQAVADARHVIGRLSFMFPWLARHTGKALPLVLAVLLVVAIAVVGWLVKTQGDKVGGFLTVLMPAVLFAGEVARRLGTARKSVDAMVDLLEKARKSATVPAAASDGGERQAINACDARIAAAEARLAHCDQAIADASRRIQEIEAGALVYDFLRERAGDERYRSRLGVVSMLRQDLESLQRKLKALEDVRGGNGGGEITPIRRIVLFIDDLDRCEPDRVVDVLQAVHLLLAFPLFAVIVAVDPRWLERSLYKRYLPGFENMSEDARAASEFSPHNYLEKIFQIPYRVPLMTADGFEALIVSHAPVAEEQAEGANAAKANADAVAGADADADAAMPPPEGDAPGMVGAEAEPPPPPPPPPPAQPEFALETAEQAFLTSLHAFAGTPRLVKRLVNAYALLRLQVHMVPGGDWAGFLRSGHRAAALLLAMDVGFPVATRVLRHEMAKSKLEFPDILADLAAQSSNRSELNRQCLGLAEALRTLRQAPGRAEVLPWLEAVGRFCFHEPCSVEELSEEMASRPAPTPAQ